MEISDEQRARLQAIGTNIRVLRVKRDMASDTLAREAGMDRSYVWKIERGHTNPTAVTLMRIADALDVSLAEIVAE